MEMELTDEDIAVAKMTGVSLPDFLAMKRQLAAEGRLPSVESPKVASTVGLHLTTEEREACAAIGVAPADFLAAKQLLAMERAQR
jgi:phage I-like protein